MTQLEIVQNRINKTPSIIFTRGKDLFSRGKISLDRLEEETSYHFKVKGNQVPFYHVNIAFSEKHLTHDCECRYHRQGDVCKHVAAGYLFLDEYLEAQMEVVIQEEATIEFEQPLVIAIGEGDRKELFAPFKSRLTQHLVAENIICTPGVITAELLEPWEVGHHLPTRTKVEQLDGEYHIRCDDSSHKGDCNHIQWMIDFSDVRS